MIRWRQYQSPAIFGAAGGGGGRSYVYRGNSGDLGSGTTFSLDIGTASADRLVVVGIEGQTQPQTFSATVNGTSLTQSIYYDDSGAGYPVALFGGLVTAGSGVQSIVVTSTQTDVIRVVHVWTVMGLTSNTVKQTTSGLISSTISVGAGDVMFAVCRTTGATPPSYSSSTQAPSAVHADNTYGGFGGADWTISATNASFTVQPGPATNYPFVAVTYS